MDCDTQLISPHSFLPFGLSGSLITYLVIGKQCKLQNANLQVDFHQSCGFTTQSNTTYPDWVLTQGNPDDIIRVTFPEVNSPQAHSRHRHSEAESHSSCSVPLYRLTNN